MRNLLLATTVATGVVALGAAANAQTLPFTVYGGGSTLAVNLYNRTAAAIASKFNVGSALTLGTDGSITGSGINVFGVTLSTTVVSGHTTTLSVTGGEMLYTADGSGSGQKAFLLQNEALHDSTQLAGVPVHYGASDAYLSTTQIACWNTGNCVPDYGVTLTTAPKTLGGYLVQVPAFGAPVAIAHTNNYAKGIALDDNDLCGIFSGNITDWGNVETKPSGTAPSASSGTIAEVIYRSDGSGTSFLMTQHLNAVCTGANTATGVTFVTSKYFGDSFAGQTGHIVPSSFGPFTGESGSGNVANELVTGLNKVAYLTPDYTAIAPSSIPVTNNVNFGYISAAKLWNSISGKYYKANPAGAKTALASPTNATYGNYNPGFPSTASAALNTAQYIPYFAQPIDGYPVSGYTTLDFATCYNTTGYVGTTATVLSKTQQLAALNYIKGFLTQLWTADSANLKLEGFTALPSTYGKQLNAIFVTGKTVYNIAFNNAKTCGKSTLPFTDAQGNSITQSLGL